MWTRSQIDGPLSVILAVFIGKQELFRCTFLTLHWNVLIEVLAYLA
jgi:hypothetical protein